VVRDPGPWTALAKAYREHGLVLVIGAGASVASGIPSWQDLLARIANGLRRRGDRDFAEGGRLVEDLRASDRFSLAAIASLLRAKSGSERRFTERLRKALYAEFAPYQLPKSDRRAWYAAVRAACEPNTTLRAVAALCAIGCQSGRRVAYRRNPRIHAVVSFNVDTLLRAYVEARYGRPGGHVLVRTVERASKEPSAKKTSIHHMHGLLRFDERVADEAADKLVFTEQQYFDFFNDPTSQFNYTFLYLLREHPCLFVGLSMRDDNIRRLLHYSRAERKLAHAEEERALRRAGRRRGGPPEGTDPSRRHFALLQCSSSAAVDALTERSLADLGTAVVWVDDFKAIPARLGRVYAAGRDGPWRLVYGGTGVEITLPRPSPAP
jgi:hypothetical protein